MSIRISKTSKLDGVLSWSLQAGDTCPGSYDELGFLVDACAGCYAKDGHYHMPNVIEPRVENREDWERPEWEDEMVARLEGQDEFRWLDSGDMYALKLAWKMYRVMERTPWCKHWLPTRMHKFAKFANVIAYMALLPNAAVRLSSDSIVGAFVPGLHGSVIYPAGTTPPEGTYPCPAYTRGGKCGPCRACYDKTIPVIAYPTHGRKMTKLVNQKLAGINIKVETFAKTA